MLQRCSRICWKWSMFWKACNKQSTWECWMCTGCYQQRSATDSARTRSWSGIPKMTVSKILAQNLGMKCIVANSFCDFCYQSRRNIVLQLEMSWFKQLPMNWIFSRRSYPRRGLRQHCPISSINVSSFHSTWLGIFWTSQKFGMKYWCCGGYITPISYLSVSNIIYQYYHSIYSILSWSHFNIVVLFFLTSTSSHLTNF